MANVLIFSTWFATSKQIIGLLDLGEKRRLLNLFLLLSTAAIFDLIGIAAIIPFMVFASDIGSAHSYPGGSIIISILDLAGFESEKSKLLALAGSFFLLICVSVLVRVSAVSYQIKFVLMVEAALSSRLFSSILGMSYDRLKGLSAANFSQDIMSEVSAVVNQVLTPTVNLFSYGIVASLLIVLLFLVDPIVSIVATGFLFLAYSATFLTLKKRMTKAGERRVHANNSRFVAAETVAKSVKALKHYRLENRYVSYFSRAAIKYGEYQATGQILAIVPRYALEALSFGGMVGLIIFLVADRGSFSAAVPILSAYAFAGYRLIPAMQQVYGSISQIRFGAAAMDRISSRSVSTRTPTFCKIECSAYDQKIVFQGVSFHSPNGESTILDAVSFVVDGERFIGIYGSSGSGKTTLLDLMLGLVAPTRGAIEIGGRRVSSPTLQFVPVGVGYVDQAASLIEGSVLDNILFGQTSDQVDYKKLALIEEVLLSTGRLREGFLDETVTGLSGGQKQLVGIGRGLYFSETALFIDEGTSGLDLQAEDRLMAKIMGDFPDLRLVLVTHRPESLSRAETIISVSDGRVRQIDSI